MKLLIASDIHGSLPAAQQVVKAFKEEKADYLVYLGDLMYHGPRNPLPDGYAPAEVAQLFNEISDKIIAMRGNCDSEVDDMLTDFPLMADYQTIPLGDKKLFATHGHIFEPENMPKNVVPKDVFAFGHIHIPMIKTDDAGVVIFNPGSAALPKEGHPPTYGVLTCDYGAIKTFDGKVYMDLKL